MAKRSKRGKHKALPKDPPWVLRPAPGWKSGLRPTDEVGINPKDRLGAAKVPLRHVNVTSQVLQALCMDDGSVKYGPYNYAVEPIQAIGYLEACQRHVLAILDGQDFDSLTGKPHIGYALSTLGIYGYAWLNGSLIDNRPVPGVGGLLLDALATTPGAPPRSPEDYRRIFDTIQEAGRRQKAQRR